MTQQRSDNEIRADLSAVRPWTFSVNPEAVFGIYARQVARLMGDVETMLDALPAVERGIACPVPGCSGDQCVLCEGEMRLPLGEETDRALAVLTGNMQRQYDELYGRMSGYLEQAEARAERVEALAAGWEADEREYLATVGQHMPCSLATVAEQVRAALGSTA